MAARIRASFTDDDSLSDHLTLEMVRISAPQTTASTINNDPDERLALNDSMAITAGGVPATTNHLSTCDPGLMEGVNPEYEISNLFTYKRVISFRFISKKLLTMVFLDRIVTGTNAR